MDSAGRHLLSTRAGPVDLLDRVKDGRGYEELRPHSETVEIEEGVSVRVLNLRTLIALKEAMGTETDVAVLPILRRTLEERGEES